MNLNVNPLCPSQALILNKPLKTLCFEKTKPGIDHPGLASSFYQLQGKASKNKAYTGELNRHERGCQCLILVVSCLFLSPDGLCNCFNNNKF